MKILLIEDNRSISKPLCYTLNSKGYEVILCENCEEALKQAAGNFGLMIIDVTLPDGNGFELYSDMKKLDPPPAIFLTARDDDDSIVKGFELGAEDYITKPFSTRELLARIGRFERKAAQRSSIIRIGDTELDTDASVVRKNGEPVELTALEYRIFSMLMMNAGKTVTREAIFERIWDLGGNYVNDNTLTVYIKRIRKKLGNDLIKTVKGIGYRLEEK